MDLKFKNQDNTLSDEYSYDRITSAIKSLIIDKNSYFSLKDNFNGFINLYKDWRIKAIKQLIKLEEKETYGKYFESFIYNWIAFNACYSFYREMNTNQDLQNDDKFDYESTNIVLLRDFNLKNLKGKIMDVYANESFKQLLHRNLSNLKDHERIKIEKLLNIPQTKQDFMTQSEEVTKRIYWFITYRLKRVRNNLFHGKKSHENIEDQAIVKDAAKLLNYFLFQFEIDFLQTIRDRLIE
jgi:hypothetical protein